MLLPCLGCTQILKFKKKKILVRVGYGFGKSLTSTHVGHVSDTGTWAK